MFKKLVSLSLVTALTLSTASAAFAASLPDGDSVEGAGEGIGIADADITSFTVPTDNAFDFYYDPQGLTGITDGGAKLSELSGGNIVMKGENAPEFINKSGFDVEVTAEVLITKGDLTILTTTTGMNSETTPGTPDTNALFYVQPSTVDVVATGAENGYVPTEKGIVVPEAGLDLVFALPAADYTITKNGNAYDAELIADSIHGSAILVGGYVNPNADYSGITGTKLSVEFTVTKKAIADDIDYDDGVVAFGLVKPDAPYTLVEPVVAAEKTVGFINGISEILSKIYNIDQGNAAGDVVIPFYFGDETVESIAINTSQLTSGDHYDVSGNSITLKKDRLDAIGSTGLKNFVLTLSGGGTYTIQIQVN